MSGNGIKYRCSLSNVWVCAANFIKSGRFQTTYKYGTLEYNVLREKIAVHIRDHRNSKTYDTYFPLSLIGYALKPNKVYCGKVPQKHTKPIPRGVRAIKIKAYSNTANLLARLLYSEAAGDSHYNAGRSILRAIAWVIKNRVAGNTHPNSYLSVIYQKGSTGKPHFRGIPGGDNSINWNNFPNAKGNWNVEAKNKAIIISNEVLSDKVSDPTFGSEWFWFRKNDIINPAVFIENEIKSGRLHIRLAIKNLNPHNPGTWIFAGK